MPPTLQHGLRDFDTMLCLTAAACMAHLLHMYMQFITLPTSLSAEPHIYSCAFRPLLVIDLASKHDLQGFVLAVDIKFHGQVLSYVSFLLLLSAPLLIRRNL